MSGSLHHRLQLVFYFLQLGIVLRVLRGGSVNVPRLHIRSGVLNFLHELFALLFLLLLLLLLFLVIRVVLLVLLLLVLLLFLVMLWLLLIFLLLL